MVQEKSVLWTFDFEQGKEIVESRQKIENAIQPTKT
jgi:hypothetical protein